MCHLYNSKTEKRAIAVSFVHNILGKWQVIYFIYDKILIYMYFTDEF